MDNMDNNENKSDILQDEVQGNVKKADVSRNIKKVLIVFLVCFIALIVYISYFEVFLGSSIVKNKHNRRILVKRNEVLRGTIYDKNMQVLAKSDRVNDSTQKRTYTNSEIFAHVLGYSDPTYGNMGIEDKYDSELMNDAPENFIDYILNLNFVDFFKGKSVKKEKYGHNIVTTLDSKLQKQAYDLLGDNKGAVVAINPSTGEILAMVSKPSYNPNDLKSSWKSINADKSVPLLNRAASGLYPPGSTFKTVTAVSALENIKGIQNRTFVDNGKLVFNSKQSLSNFEGETLGNLTIEQAYIHSSNVVFGQIGMELGNQNLKTTAQKFYFNSNIPCNDIDTAKTKFPTYKSYEKGNIAQSAIGQSEVLASPFEMALVASTIANNGTMMKPYLVKEITDKDNKTIKTIQPQGLGNVVDPNIAQIMKKYMREVVTSGTGSAANVAGLNICGKTGTAEHGGTNTEPHSWFISFGPSQSPKIAIAVVVENGGQGGGTAANISAQLLKTALSK